MKVGLLTREYPPEVYGGAGVHVEFLARELRPLVDLAVRCWGAGRPVATGRYRPDPGSEALATHGIDPDRPYVPFVGRITRQKGVPHLVRAGASLDPGVQLVLCAGGADTPALDAEFRGLVADLEKTRTGVRWLPEMLPRNEVVQLMTHATVFACPSVYEPLGIVHLEAMAC